MFNFAPLDVVLTNVFVKTTLRGVRLPARKVLHLLRHDKYIKFPCRSNPCFSQNSMSLYFIVTIYARKYQKHEFVRDLFVKQISMKWKIDLSDPGLCESVVIIIMVITTDQIPNSIKYCNGKSWKVKITTVIQIAF